MSIFSLDLSKPIDLNIHAEANIDEILNILVPTSSHNPHTVLTLYMTAAHASRGQLFVAGC